MSFFVKAVSASKPKSKDAVKISYILSVIMLGFGITQLLTFSYFFDHVQNLDITSSVNGSHLIAALVIVTEFLSIPFLLRFRLSPLARILSMACGWFASIFWISVPLIILTSQSSITNIGFLGGVTTIVPGWWAVFIGLAIALLFVWTSWAFWPCRKLK